MCVLQKSFCCLCWSQSRCDGEVEWIERLSENSKKRASKSFYGLMLIHACTFSHYNESRDGITMMMLMTTIYWLQEDHDQKKKCDFILPLLNWAVYLFIFSLIFYGFVMEKFRLFQPTKEMGQPNLINLENSLHKRRRQKFVSISMFIRWKFQSLDTGCFQQIIIT